MSKRKKREFDKKGSEHMCRYEQLRDIIREKRKELDALKANDTISKEELYAKSVELDGYFAQMQELLMSESK